MERPISSRPSIVTLLVVLTVASILTNAALAQTGNLEIHSFDTATVNEVEFLTGKPGKPTRIAGVLRLPIGQESFPAVILMHSSGGLTGNVDEWAQELNRIGVAAFVVDIFTGLDRSQRNK